MTKWAPALFSSTPSTDYRWLALPADIANDPVDRKRAVGLSSDIPHRGNDRPRMWVVRSDGKHVWFGTWGEVSRIFGEMRSGVRISRAGSDPTDHRENIAFAGYVTKRSDFSGLPVFSHEEAHPAFVQGHADHLLDMWGEKGRVCGAHSPVIPTAYDTELPLAKNHPELPEGWAAQLRKAEERIKQGHSFQLNCFEGRQAEFVELEKDGQPCLPKYAPSPSGIYDEVRSSNATIEKAGAWADRLGEFSRTGRGMAVIGGTALLGVVLGALAFRQAHGHDASSNIQQNIR